MTAPLWAWLSVLAVIGIMLAVDLFAHRRAHTIELREAAVWSAVWVTIGLGFGGIIWFAYGAEFATQYYSGYLIEKSLAVDNVFVWAVIFSYFAVPREYQHRVLFLGVIGALVFRGVLIAAGSVLIANYLAVLYLFGVVLLITGAGMIRRRNAHYDPDSSRMMRVVRRVLPTTDEFHGQRLLIRRAGRWVATPLLLVLLLVEASDLLFAIDSIPAIFAVTQEPFLVFTANAFAILGLRAMYFLLADLMHRFVYLKLGLGLVLIWVGVKLILQVDIYKMPTVISLAVIATIIAVSIGASLWRTRRADAPDSLDQQHRRGQDPQDSVSEEGVTHDGTASVDLPDQPWPRPGVH